ncbi:MAG: hypothetical protein MKZ80_06660 [Candidatus Nitrosopelagicus sp.]|nr:hypothetical protein [Candidatus Nitrosopelagicus sp.]|tara:strand:+ start:707 stop:1159 length:453 start_codon:yes stop_codon:yes gene_type:complete
MTENSSKKNFLTYDVLVNTLWVSTILALILTLPSVGIFLYVFLETGSWLTGALLAFGIHFVILAFSERISNFLLKFSFFEESKCIFSDSLFPNDYLTFETDNEEIKILANQKKGKKQVQIHSYLLDHQLFHQIIHSRTNCISDYSLSRVF